MGVIISLVGGGICMWHFGGGGDWLMATIGSAAFGFMGWMLDGAPKI